MTVTKLHSGSGLGIKNMPTLVDHQSIIQTHSQHNKYMIYMHGKKKNSYRREERRVERSKKDIEETSRSR